MSAPRPSSAPPAAPLGQILRDAREARNLSLDTVADELMIRRYYLESLEEGLYRQLPERVYAVGFVQNYAQLMGLDVGATVEQFKREAYGGRGAAVARMELTMPAPATQNLLPNRSTLFIIGGLLVVLVVGGIAWNARAPRTTEARIPQPPVQANDVSLKSVASTAPVPETTAIVSSNGTVTTANPPLARPETARPAANTPADATPDFASAAPSSPQAATDPADELPAAPDTTSDTTPAASGATASAEAPAGATSPVTAPPVTAPPVTVPPVAVPPVAVPQGTRILIEAIQPSWVEIADGDGNILFTNILRLGQALPIPDKAGITLTTGNAAGVQIVLDGKKQGPLGRAGEVKRAIALDPAKLATAAR